MPMNDMQGSPGEVNFWNFPNASKMVVRFCLPPKTTDGEFSLYSQYSEDKIG